MGDNEDQSMIMTRLKSAPVFNHYYNRIAKYRGLNKEYYDGAGVNGSKTI